MASRARAATRTEVGVFMARRMPEKGAVMCHGACRGSREARPFASSRRRSRSRVTPCTAPSAPHGGIRSQARRRKIGEQRPMPEGRTTMNIAHPLAFLAAGAILAGCASHPYMAPSAACRSSSCDATVTVQSCGKIQVTPDPIVVANGNKPVMRWIPGDTGWSFTRQRHPTLKPAGPVRRQGEGIRQELQVEEQQLDARGRTSTTVYVTEQEARPCRLRPPRSSTSNRLVRSQARRLRSAMSYAERAARGFDGHERRRPGLPRLWPPGPRGTPRRVGSRRMPCARLRLGGAVEAAAHSTFPAAPTSPRRPPARLGPRAFELRSSANARASLSHRATRAVGKTPVDGGHGEIQLSVGDAFAIPPSCARGRARARRGVWRRPGAFHAGNCARAFTAGGDVARIALLRGEGGASRPG